MSFPLIHALWYQSADPEDYSSAVRYNVTFSQTAFTDSSTPASHTVSSPIIINIMDDNIVEGLECFHARIVETPDLFRVRIGPQDTVNVTIIDNDSESTIASYALKIFVQSASL